MSPKRSEDTQRPRTLQTSRSFSRLEPPPVNTASPTRTRASTIQTPVIASVPEARQIDVYPEGQGEPKSSDIFETSEQHDDSLDTDLNGPRLQQPETLEQLPIEIRSLTERYVTLTK